MICFSRRPPGIWFWCFCPGVGQHCCPLPVPGLTLEDLQATTDLLLRAGATIVELNAVRKHLSRLTGGQMARLAAPAQVAVLILSDVVGDPLDAIASGPMAPDPDDVRRCARCLASLRSPVAGSFRGPRPPEGRGRVGGTLRHRNQVTRSSEKSLHTIVGSNCLAAEAVVTRAQSPWL